MLEQPAVKILETIANSMVGFGRYGSQAEALRAMAMEQVNRKISLYERRVKRFEKKHRGGFEKFSKRLKGRATIQQEDEWMEWEAAIEMLDAWRTASQALQN